MTIEKEVQALWNKSDFLAIDNNKTIIAWSYSKRRVYDHAIERGVSSPWVIPASASNVREFELSEEIKDLMEFERMKKKYNYN